MKVEQQQKMDPRWEKILEIRRQRLAILDSGATSGAAGEEDEYGLIDTGQQSNKTFMFPNNAKQKATKKMHHKHDIRQEAKEMNIIPGLHAPLISVPKLADAGYITVFEKNIAIVYDKATTTVTASKRPVLQAPRCQTSGLWTMGLEPSKRTGKTEAAATPESINALFDLPSTKQKPRKATLREHDREFDPQNQRQPLRMTEPESKLKGRQPHQKKRHTPKRMMCTSEKWKCQRQYTATARAHSHTHCSGATRLSWLQCISTQTTS